MVIRREIQTVLIFFNIRVFLLFPRGADIYECYGKILSKILIRRQYLMKATRPSQLKERA